MGQEPNVTAREALLRWARRSTARYPGVRVTDFTGSWRDGLAFSALIHRNRPDLVDWRGARASQPRERLDRVFHVAEREYGVTRLLDPEGNEIFIGDKTFYFSRQVSPVACVPFSPSFVSFSLFYKTRCLAWPVSARRLDRDALHLLPSAFSLFHDKPCLFHFFVLFLLEMESAVTGSSKCDKNESILKYRDKVIFDTVKSVEFHSR